MTEQAARYASPAHYHRHRCHACELVWEHHTDNDQAPGCRAAHTCPGCGQVNSHLAVYVGGEPPAAWNGTDPGPPVGEGEPPHDPVSRSLTRCDS